MSANERGKRPPRQVWGPNGPPPINEGRVAERNFDILQTHLPDVYALVEHDADPDYRKSTVRGLRAAGNVYFARAETIKQLQAI